MASRAWASSASTSVSRRLRFAPATLLTFVLIASAGFTEAGAASAGPAFPLRRVARAPGHAFILSNSILQPPGDEPPGGDEGDDEEDKPKVEPNVPEVPDQGVIGGQQPPKQNQFPVFGAQDTTGRRDSLLILPMAQPAPAETIGSQPRIAAGAPGMQPKTSKKGLLGLHPAAIIAATVVLHVFIVGLATK